MTNSKCTGYMGVISFVKEERVVSRRSGNTAIRCDHGIYETGARYISGSPGFQLVTIGDV